MKTVIGKFKYCDDTEYYKLVYITPVGKCFVMSSKTNLLVEVKEEFEIIG